MRGMLIWLAVVACGEPDATVPDANEEAGGGPDATVICGDLLPFDASQAFDVVSDNANVFVSIKALDGTMQIVTIPISGGPASTLVTGTERFVIDAFDDALFYNTRVGQTYELHQYVGGIDTLLDTVPADGEIEIEANATDLYVLGPDGMDKTTLWRLPRAGAGNGPTPEVTSLAGTGGGLALGDTVAAFYVDGTLEFETLPGPSRPTERMTAFGEVWFIGDLAFEYAAYMSSQNTTWAKVNQVWPTEGTVWVHAYFMADMPLPGGMFTDDKYIYLMSGGSLTYMTTAGMTVGTTCGASRGRYDQTHLIGLRACSGGSCAVNLVPKPL